MGIFSKRCLLPLFFSGCVCLAIFWPNQVVRAADSSQSIEAVSVEITKLDNGNNQISLRWRLATPVNGGTISYEIQKSTDGGLNFNPMANISATNWTDNNGGAGLPNYINLIYRLRSVETVGETTYESPFSSPVNVYLPNVNVHDNYMSNTNLCSTCHSTHTAKEDTLLNEPSNSAFCLTCHAGSTNSKYDVNNGTTMTADSIPKPSLGGAFMNASSAHNLDKTMPVPAPGYGGTNASEPMTMGCTTCHSAHGTGNYRMLNNTITVPTAPDISIPFDINLVAGAETKTPSSSENPVYISGVATLCQSCHANYTEGKIGHPVNVAIGTLTTSLPLEGTSAERANNSEKMTCLTCHSSHGSTSNNLTVSPGNDLCLKCHTTDTEPTSGFSNEYFSGSQLNLHNAEGSYGGHLDCSSCHVTHGDSSKGLLIGDGNPITSVDSESGTNNWYYDSCATSCHVPGSGA